MKIKILHRETHAVLVTGDYPSLKVAVQKKKHQLCAANLDRADLSGAGLSGADLTGADLWGANLREANLRDADLTEADLRGANLSFANLSFANLSEADLYGADLSFANLRGTNCTAAILGTTNLSGVDLSRTNLNGVDLSDVDLSRTVFDGTTTRTRTSSTRHTGGGRVTTQDVLDGIDWELLAQQWESLGRASEAYEQSDPERAAHLNGLWEFIGHLLCAHNDGCPSDNG